MRRHLTAPAALRPAKRRIARLLSNRLLNPLVRPAIERGLLTPTWALLETTGRRSGLPRRTPVGNGLRGSAFWIVTEHGYAADYVKNIQADPRVRIKLGPRWLSGTARILPDDPPYERLRWLARPLNDVALLGMGTEQLFSRVYLHSPPPV